MLVGKEAITTLSTTLFLLAGCAESPEDRLTQDVTNAIALCSSGLSISKGAQLTLTAEIFKALEGQNSLNASTSVTNAIRGIAFTEEGLQNENVFKAFQTYDACVRSDLSAYLG